MTWVIRNGELVEKYGPFDVRSPPARSALACPNIIGDVLPDVIGPGGVPYSSKSALRAEYRAQGLVEMGNDAPLVTVDNRNPVIKADVGLAYQMVRDGYRPAPLETGVLPSDD